MDTWGQGCVGGLGCDFRLISLLISQLLRGSQVSNNIIRCQLCRFHHHQFLPYKSTIFVSNYHVHVSPSPIESATPLSTPHFPREPSQQIPGLGYLFNPVTRTAEVIHAMPFPTKRRTN